jgi:peptidoglycan hydrolase-like protein with peptidoglycan-binding domain
MASQVGINLATLAIVAAMVAPALAQSAGTGSAPKTGSGGSATSATPAPATTQPGSSTQPAVPPAGPGAAGKAKSGTEMGQSGAAGPGAGATSKPARDMNGRGSEQVKAVQKALQDNGIDPGPIDGIMGPKTTAALKAFQKDQKLTASGRLDEQTREKLGVSR